MKFQHLAIGASLALGGFATLVQAPAQAFAFQTNFTPALPGADQPKGDIILDSVQLADGTVLSDFTLVTNAIITYNDVYVDGNTGAASSDIGDMATTGVKVEDASSADLVAVLNNQNLNNIIDTEDDGKFEIDLFFENVVDNIFLWERGQNSELDIQALDASGNLIGSLVSLGNSSGWQDAGYSIDTQEINGAQAVSSIGISLADLGVEGPISGLRVISESDYNGPDWKLMGSVADVPEPSAMLGLGMAVGGLLLRRRKHSAIEA